MSGHSKWSTIKRKKAATDQKRGQVFSKLSKLITVTAKDSPDPQTNPHLRSVIEKARAMSMPNANIERALKRAQDRDEAQLERLMLEAIGAKNIVFIIEAITDNRNRTLGELKRLMAQHNIKDAREGSFGWMFEPRGVFRVENFFKKGASNVLEGKLELQLIDAGAQDITRDEDILIIYTTPDNTAGVKTVLDGVSLPYQLDIELVPKEPLHIDDENILKIAESVCDAFLQHDDVENVYTNLA